MPDLDDLQPGARTFTFDDDDGRLYVVIYGRNARGLQTWRVIKPNGRVSEVSDWNPDHPDVQGAAAVDAARGVARLAARKPGHLA